jgi:hypothetical protein
MLASRALICLSLVHASVALSCVIPNLTPLFLEGKTRASVAGCTSNTQIQSGATCGVQCRASIVLRPLAVPSRCLALPCLALPCLFCWRWISRLVRSMDVFCVHAPVTGYGELPVAAGTAATATYVCTSGVLTPPSLTCTPGISATPLASRLHSFPSLASCSANRPGSYRCRRLFDRLRSSGSCTFPAMPEGTKPSSREPP